MYTKPQDWAAYTLPSVPSRVVPAQAPMRIGPNGVDRTAAPLAVLHAYDKKGLAALCGASGGALGDERRIGTSGASIRILRKAPTRHVVNAHPSCAACCAEMHRPARNAPPATPLVKTYTAGQWR